MSNDITTHVWDHSKQTGAHLLILLAIADHANDEGVCWPGIDRLAQRARVSKRHAKRIISDLEAAGELIIERGAGRGNTSLYYIKGDAPVTNRELKGDAQGTYSDIEKVTPTSIKGDIPAQKVTPRVIKGDIAMSPEPIEPSIEPSVNHKDRSSSSLPVIEIDPALAEVIAHYEKTIGCITEPMGEVLKGACKEYPTDWITDALDIAVDQAKKGKPARKWSYVRGILRNWQSEGKGGNRQNRQGRPDQPREYTSTTPDPSYYEPAQSPVPEVFIDIARSIPEMNRWEYEIDDEQHCMTITTQYDPRLAGSKFGRHIELALKIDPAYCGYAYEFENGAEH